MSTNDITIYDETYRGYTIELHPDDNAGNPRTEWDNVGTMVCFHRRYNLGDKTNINHDDFESWKELAYYLIKNKGAAVIRPLYLYDHSGVTIRTGPFSCPWDSGQAGFIYVTKDRIHKEWGKGPAAYKKARKHLEGEVKTYDDFLTGNVVGYVVEDKDGVHISSCWGFYGDEGRKDAISEAKQCVDYAIEKEHKEHIQYVKTAIRNRMPLSVRMLALAN